MAFTSTFFIEEARINKKNVTKQMDGVRSYLHRYPLEGGWDNGREEMYVNGSQDNVLVIYFTFWVLVIWVCLFHEYL